MKNSGCLQPLLYGYRFKKNCIYKTSERINVELKRKDSSFV